MTVGADFGVDVAALLRGQTLRARRVEAVGRACVTAARGSPPPARWLEPDDPDLVGWHEISPESLCYDARGVRVACTDTTCVRGPCSDSPEGESSTSSSGGSSASEYSDMGDYLLHRDMPERYHDLIAEAWQVMVDHRDIVQDWFDRYESSLWVRWACMRERMRPHDDGRKVRIGYAEDVGWNARTFWLEYRLNVSERYLSAIQGAIDALPDMIIAGSGQRECYVLALARTLVHELSHQCFGTERLAYVLGSYFQWQVMQTEGYDHANCCCYAADSINWRPEAYYYDAGDEGLTGIKGVILAIVDWLGSWSWGAAGAEMIDVWNVRCDHVFSSTGALTTPCAGGACCTGSSCCGSAGASSGAGGSATRWDDGKVGPDEKKDIVDRTER